jgi:cold shock CspA family protein/GTP-binding protein EngB required for normal cell division
MQTIENKIYKGKIESYKGQFGFIESELGNTFFHKTGLNVGYIPVRNDIVEFKVRNSRKKTDLLEAYDIFFNGKIVYKEDSKINEQYILGTVKWFDYTKGFGFIFTKKGDYYIHKSGILPPSIIFDGDKVLFNVIDSKGKLSAINCQRLVDGLSYRDIIEQQNILNDYLSSVTCYNSDNYQVLKSIAKNKELDKNIKNTFLISAFEKSTAEYQYKILFEDNLIDIQNETSENQIELLQKLERLDFKRIKSIAQSDKIEEPAKDAFLKSAFEKTSTEYQFNMIVDGFISITEQEQTKFLQRYLTELGNINLSTYDRIKSIAVSDKFEKTVMDAFQKLAFEKANSGYQFKMFFEGLVTLSEESQIKLIQKYLLELGEINFTNYNQIKSISQSDKIEKTVKNAFLRLAFEKANPDYQYRMLFIEYLIDIQKETSESQIQILQKFERLEIEKIKFIAQTDKIEKVVRDAFLKFIFDRANVEYQYKLMIEGIIILSEESQIKVLEKYFENERTIGKYTGRLRLDFDIINSILQTNKIEISVKDAFLKFAFEKADAESQYKMLFVDNLIDIQKETSEYQVELLRKFGRLDIDKIKSISQSDKIEKKVKDVFLDIAFEKAKAECQYKMLFDDCLLQDISKKLEFLLNTTQSGRIRFSKGQYGGKTYFEVLEKDIEYLHKNRNQKSNIDVFYMIKHGYWSYDGGEKNEYSLSSTYKQWKESWFSILEEVNREIEYQKIFADDSAEELYKKITQINDAKELYEIFEIDFNEIDFKNAIKSAILQLDFNFLNYIDNYKWLTCFKQYNSEYYNSLFEQNYPQISKINRLRLWLQNLNPYYHYLELVQSAWLLSNDERKLLNKRIKEHAKDERLQKFYDQIPIAELIKETEITKTYKCKWRNLYYKNGSVQVFFDKSTSSEDYPWESSREEWNLLTHEYFNNRRIDDIIATVNNNNHITKITGLEDIEVKIVIAEVRKNGTSDRKTNISSSQISKIIHNISARNQCINFLARQNSDYNVLDIQELVTDDYGSLRRDVSFIFPIPNGKGNVYLIWESAEFEKSKATHIFKCSEEELESVESKIKEFIESNLRTRSRLNSVEIDDLEVKKELQYFCRINHDSVEYQVWENRMREVLYFLK